jgi:SAM-dependent MidA family methyltransferase
MDVTPLLRRPGVPAPAGSPPPSDPELLARIRAEIAARGPMTFARFMELALYDPDAGYYRRATPGPGREGDYITAPEMHPLFGATLARVVAEVWRAANSPDRFAIVEYGAGSGALAVSLLAALADEEEALARAAVYIPIELNEHRLAEVRARLASADLAAALGSQPPPSSGIAIANEYLDALPVHVVEQHQGRLVEIHVGVSSERELIEGRGDLSSPALAARLSTEGIDLADGQRAEICLGLTGWADDVACRLEQGVVLAIDYGAEATELYGPTRPAGTLLAYAGHRAHANPFVSIGRQDLTAHVDMTAVAAALATAGWRVLGGTSQAVFLVGSGMEEVLVRLRARAPDIESHLALRSATGRLLDPRATGAFRVLAAARGMPASFTLDGLRNRP